MRFRTVLVESFRMLRDDPRIFIPRLAMTLIWSVFWLYLVYLFDSSTTVTTDHIVYPAIFVFIMTPVELWVYNAYFFMVKQQHEHDDIQMQDAFQRGLFRLPQSITMFCLLGTMAAILGTPGAILFLYGLSMNLLAFQLVGLVISITAVLGVMLTAYFTPISVVLGEQSFFQNVKNGLTTSRDARHSVYLITLFSFTVLLLAGVARGSLQQIGIAGFLVGRLLASVESVYLLIVNPELFLQHEEQHEDAENEQISAEAEQEQTAIN